MHVAPIPGKKWEEWMRGAFKKGGAEAAEALNELFAPENGFAMKRGEEGQKGPAGEGAQAIKGPRMRKKGAIARFLAERAEVNGEHDEGTRKNAAKGSHTDNRGMVPVLSILLNWFGIPLKRQPGIESVLCVAGAIGLLLVIASQNLVALIIGVILWGAHYIIRSRAPPHPWGVLAVTLMHIGLLRLLPSPTLQAGFILSAIAILILSIALHYLINQIVSFLETFPESIDTYPSIESRRMTVGLCLAAWLAPVLFSRAAGAQQSAVRQKAPVKVIYYDGQINPRSFREIALLLEQAFAQAKAEGKTLRIDVEDDGPGLPEAALGAIFEPFVRFREDRGNDGYGLGLAITRQTIEAHGGSVCALNREHGGLRFELRLPASFLHGSA